MFARSRSSLLPRFYVGILTCCVLVIGTVSSMSLDRLGRQYQQQNDKQLDLNEFMLPEADSEMLQNDMELVPAIDGNSDMYLLVPASATSQEQNLQSLTELKESQNTENVENNSDMLMLESEDFPEVQFFKLPEYETQSKFDQEFQAQKELDEMSHFTNKNKEDNLNNDDQEVSEGMIDAIAEAAQEIKNEIETELMESDETPKDEELQKAENIEHKDGEVVNANVHENEDAEGEMIGVVSEESNEEPTASLENGSQQESEKNNEDLQAVESEIELIHQAQEQTLGESLDIQSNQNFVKQTVGEENENADDRKDKPETFTHDADQMAEEVLKDEKDRKSEADKTPTEFQEQTFETNMGIQSGNEIPIQSDAEIVKFAGADAGESEAVVKPLAEETSVVENATKNDAAGIDETNFDETDEIQVDGIKPERNKTFEEAQVDIKITETGQPNKEAEDFTLESQTYTKEQPSKYIQQHMEPIQTELLEETHAVAESEKPQTDEEIDNKEDSGNDISVGEKESNTEISNAGTDSIALSYMPLDETDKFEQSQLISESQIIEGFHGVDEEVSSVEEEVQQQLLDAGKMSQKDEQNEELESFENSQLSMVAPSADKLAEAPEKLKDVDNFLSVSKYAQPMEDSDLVADVLSTEKTEQSEKVHSDKEMQSIEKLQNVEEILSVDNAHSVVKAQTADELRPVEEDALLAQNTQVPQENAHDEEVELIESIEDKQSLEETTPVNKTESNEKTEIQSTEETLSSEDPSIEDTQPVEYSQYFDVQQSTENTMPKEENPYEDVVVGAEVKPVTSLGTTSPPIQQTENLDIVVAHQEFEHVEEEPVKISSNEFLAADSNKKDGELADEYTLQNVEAVETNKNQEIQQSATEIQSPLEDKNSDNIINYEPIKTNTSILTSIVQVPTKVQMPQHQQHQQKNEQKIQEQQPTIVETISSTTLRPLYALDTVFNYVNASFMNQANTGDNNNNRQEGNEKEQAFSSKLRRYDGAQVWRIVVQNDRERKLADELQTKFDGQLWKEVKQEVDYLLKPQVLADAEHHVRAANLTRIVLIDNLQKVIEVENPPAEEIAQLQNRKGYRLTWQAYHRLEDIHSYFDYLAKTYPDICSVETIGYSIEKRPLKILKISNGNATNPGIWIDGGMHAREWISPAVVTYITNQIVEGWDDLPAYLRNINWYVHAVANPDGYEYSHTTDRLWRKNRRSHGRACPGVDLNRNFGYKWGGQGTSANPCAQTYRGSKAFSEPETFYISKFISNFPRETFKAYLSFHSYGQYILYPWGYGYHVTKDMPDLDLVARQAGTIITKSSGAKFTVGSSATTLYPAAGGSDDWAKGIAGIKYSYTIEMGDTGRYGFVLPASYIESNGKNGLIVVETVAKAITMGKTGRKRKLKAYKVH